jgi:anti-anti-sigma factor
MENQAGWPEDQARTTVVSLPGEVSYYNATQVHEELMAALEPGVTTVILDLTLTTFFDSAGLSKIAVARRLASAYRIDLRVVVPPSSPLAGFFASSGFDRLLAIYPTLRAALTAPRPSREDTRTALCPAARSKGRSTTRTGTGSPRDWAPSSRPRTRSHQRAAMTVPNSCTATAQPKASR